MRLDDGKSRSTGCGAPRLRALDVTSGDVGKVAITIDTVNSPPRPVIAVPTAGSSFSEGSTITLSGSATDLNEGPGPEPGTLECSRLRWASSDETDHIGSAHIGCNPTLTFGSVGARTITTRRCSSP